jgi:sensor histidine kinase regulating citrate/malate metabolism
MLCYVAFVRTNISEERIASILRVTRISELGTTLAVTSETSFLPRATQHNIPEDGILYSLLLCNVIRSSKLEEPAASIFRELHDRLSNCHVLKYKNLLLGVSDET